MPKIPQQAIQAKRRELQSVTLHGVEYLIRWENMTLGSSFFLPTTATVQQVRTALREAARVYGYRIELRTRREYGRYGVRVWRMP
jgi:hypothetical protein